MPKRIDPRESARPVSFTMTPSDLAALDKIAKRDGMNRSAWIRRQIRTHAPIDFNENMCDHLPIVRDEHSKNWWIRLGLSNPRRYGGHCVGCYGDTPPSMKKEWGRTVWTLEDGTEVIQ
jgi:hypothetical protein